MKDKPDGKMMSQKRMGGMKNFLPSANAVDNLLRIESALSPSAQIKFNYSLKTLEMKAIIRDVISGIVIKTFDDVPENEPQEKMENAKRNYCRWRKVNPDKFEIVAV